MSAADTSNDRVVAREVFARQQEILARGGIDYMRRARRCDDYYLGGGLQWRPDDRAEIEGSGRPCHEINDIMPAVNASVGYQIANRMDIAYLPLGHGTDEYMAKVFSKFAKHCLDNTGYRDLETEQFTDGLVQQRGFIDMRMDYEFNARGDILCETLDPMDVGIDPDARDYDPDTWSDLTISRWLTLGQIEGKYGKAAADYCKDHARAFGHYGNADYDQPRVPRSQFGDQRGLFGYQAEWGAYGPGLSYQINGQLLRFLIIERQSHEYRTSLVGEYPTGDLRVLEGYPREFIQQAIRHGVFVSERRIRRVRFQTVLPETVLFNGIVPYEHFTPIPFFPYFRRGRTRGMVDNAMSPQDMTNKFVSQYAAVINGVANSGWQLEEGQLANMTTAQLEVKGAQTGLILARHPGTQPLQKIEPNQLPTGIEKMVQFGLDGLRRATGVNESLMGVGNQDMSGIAIQSRQFAAQQQLAIPLWRLSQTRRMTAKRLMKLIQKFMLDERIVRISQTDEYGIERNSMMAVNQVQPDGSVLNDLTIGAYDIAITEQPMQVTFDNSQFEQIKSMRKDMGVRIPDSVVLRYSTLPDKHEIAEAMKQDAQTHVDPVEQAEAALKQAQALLYAANTELAKAKTVQTKVTSVYSATQAGAQAAAIPHLAPTADAILESSGFPAPDPVPTNTGGGIPAPVEPLSPGQVTQTTTMPGEEPEALRRMPHNTDPLTPAHPDLGVDAGIRKPGVQP